MLLTYAFGCFAHQSTSPGCAGGGARPRPAPPHVRGGIGLRLACGGTIHLGRCDAQRPMWEAGWGGVPLLKLVDKIAEPQGTSRFPAIRRARVIPGTRDRSEYGSSRSLHRGRFGSPPNPRPDRDQLSRSSIESGELTGLDPLRDRRGQLASSALVPCPQLRGVVINIIGSDGRC